MHALAKNIADQLGKKVQELNVSKVFGETSETFTLPNWTVSV